MEPVDVLLMLWKKALVCGNDKSKTKRRLLNSG